MTDDLVTLLAQTAGQLSGQMLHAGLLSIPAGMGMIGSLMNPLLLMPYGLMIGLLPAIGTIGSAAILMGLIK